MKRKMRLITLAFGLLVACGSADWRKPFHKALDSAARIQAGDNTGMGAFVGHDLIITANHVIMGEPGIWAMRPDGAWMLCTLLASDLDKDLALLRVDGTGRPIRLGAGASPGDLLFTISGGEEHPFGYSAGYARQSYEAQVQFPQGNVRARILEMSCPVNFGDSGSMIVDARGDLAGICSFYDSGKNDCYLGIDVSEIKRFLEGGR